MFLATDSIVFPVALYCSSFSFPPGFWQIMHIILSHIPEDDLSLLGVSLSLIGAETVPGDERPILFWDNDGFSYRTAF